VVSSPIRSVQDFKHVITMARERGEWSRAIEAALSAGENTPDQSARRQRIARDYDWDGLVARMVCTITKGLGIDVPDAAVSFSFEKPYDVSPTSR
jgi:hypothetical protein